jgi:2-phospho-L-lactate guanylyltransferase
VKTYIPFCPDDPKTRLSELLTDDERLNFVGACLDDVCAAVDEAGAEPVVLTTEPLGEYVAVADGYETLVRNEPLTPAVNSVLSDETPPVAVVVADLPLVTTDVLRSLYTHDADFVVAPGRGGGTNAFVTRDTDFRVSYHGVSFSDHVERARELGCDIEVLDSFRLSTDVDEPQDLVEVLLHGQGSGARFIDERFELVENDRNRVSVRRME